MFVSLALLLGSQPNLEDLYKFPGLMDADYQVKACQEHLGTLKLLRGYFPERTVFWDAAEVETRDRLDYWSRLAIAQNSSCWIDEARLAELVSIRRKIGVQRYEEGWSPPQMLRLHWPRPPVIPRIPDKRAGNNK